MLRMNLIWVRLQYRDVSGPLYLHVVIYRMLKVTKFSVNSPCICGSPHVKIIRWRKLICVGLIVLVGKMWNLYNVFGESELKWPRGRSGCCKNNVAVEFFTGAVGRGTHSFLYGINRGELWWTRQWALIFCKTVGLILRIRALPLVSTPLQFVIHRPS